MKLRTLLLPLLPLSLLFVQCGGAPDEGTEDSEAELSVADDDLNGLWITSVDGQKLGDRTVIQSLPGTGIQLQMPDGSRPLVRSADKLTGNAATLDVLVNGWSVSDDEIEGTVDGHTVTLDRDTAVKPPITLNLPGDRPYRSFLVDMLAPAAQQDRESYAVLRPSTVGAFLKTCELVKKGSFQRKYMKGATFKEQNAAFWSIVNSLYNIKTTPRRVLKEKRFNTAVTQNLKNPADAPLVLTTFGMYFMTGAGRSVRLPITNDSMAYFITDRPARAATIGLVVMDTPTHAPLASTFGRQLLDLGAMTPDDDTVFARSMMEMLAKTDSSRANQLSPAGRSAITDWFAVMAIEDYRGVAFGSPNLSWGYNMTSVQFYGLVARALARPGALDSAGKPVTAQVIVGTQLRPGDPSYADVLNNGNDMQEYQDMAALKQLATQYLRANHAQKVAAVEAAFAGIVPKNELSWRAQGDVFHLITQNLYDPRTPKLVGPAADAAIDAVVALLDALRTDSAGFEAYVVSRGYAKSNEPAPKSTGF